jgi:hypothetical protein
MASGMSAAALQSAHTVQDSPVDSRHLTSYILDVAELGNLILLLDILGKQFVRIVTVCEIETSEKANVKL